jgi:hypothetical protein
LEKIGKLFSEGKKLFSTYWKTIIPFRRIARATAERGGIGAY